MLWWCSHQSVPNGGNLCDLSSARVGESCHTFEARTRVQNRSGPPLLYIRYAYYLLCSGGVAANHFALSRRRHGFKSRPEHCKSGTVWYCADLLSLWARPRWFKSDLLRQWVCDGVGPNVLAWKASVLTDSQVQILPRPPSGK